MTFQSPVRIAQMSDLHYCGKNLAESERCFSYAVDRAIAEKVDGVVVSGDATDHALDVHAPAFVALARNIRRLADHCPVLMLQGTFSHEPPGTLSVFRLLGGCYPVWVADRLQQVALMPGGSWVGSAGWRFEKIPESARLLMSCIPTINKASVAAVVGATRAAEAVGEEMSTLLAGLAPGNRKARAKGIATVVVSHGTVSGCTTEHGVPMASLDHEFTTGSLFAAEASAVMLGHIHAHQVWDYAGRKIAYPGSIGRFHYGEQGNKGLLFWDIAADRADLALDPTPARRTIELVFSGIPDMDAVRAIASEADGAFVKISWEVAEESKASVDRGAIETALAGAAEVKLEGRIIPVVRARAAGISTAATLEEKLRQWAAVVDADPAPLAAALAELELKAPETIAAELLGMAGHVMPAVTVEPVVEVAQPAREVESLDLFS